MRGRSIKWERAELEHLERLQANDRDAKNWHRARAFLTERRLLKDFIIWDAREEGLGDDTIAVLDAACDKIEYPVGDGQNVRMK